MYKSIASAIDEYGQDIVRSNALANILLDTQGFSKPQEQLPVLRGLLNLGFGEMLLNCLENQNDDWSQLVSNYLKEYSKGKEHDFVTINYVANCLIWGIGLRRDESVFLTVKSMDEVKTMLEDAKKDYLTLLQSLLKIKESADGSQIPYYDIESSNTLYTHETRISALSFQLDIDDSWCDIQKKQVLDKHTIKSSMKKRKSDSTKDADVTFSRKTDAVSAEPAIQKPTIQPQSKKCSFFDKISNFFK